MDATNITDKNIVKEFNKVSTLRSNAKDYLPELYIRRTGRILKRRRLLIASVFIISLFSISMCIGYVGTFLLFQ